MPSPKFVGRDCVVSFAIADENANPATLNFLRLGMMRGKTMSTTWDTVDTTADTSTAFTKEALVTFKGVEFSGDGVSYGEAVANQKLLKAHVINPGAGTTFLLTLPLVAPVAPGEWASA